MYKQNSQMRTFLSIVLFCTLFFSCKKEKPEPQHDISIKITGIHEGTYDAIVEAAGRNFVDLKAADCKTKVTTASATMAVGLPIHINIKHNYKPGENGNNNNNTRNTTTNNKSTNHD